MSVQIDQSLVDAFERDGAVCIRGAFDPAQLAAAEAAVVANLASLSPLAQRASAAGDGAFIEDFCSWQRLPEVAAFACGERGAELAGHLMGAEVVRLYHDHLLVKRAGTRQPTPWHQDQPYYNVDGNLNASMWVPIDPVPRASTLEFVAGSHRGPWYLPRTFLDGRAAWFPPGALAEPPDFAADPDRFPVIGWELEPGDAVFFHMATVHGSAGVGPDRDRRVISVRYLGDDMVSAPRPWRTSPPFDGLDLAAGAPLDHPLFPVLWRRNASLS